jgi:hypothetical protein
MRMLFGILGVIIVLFSLFFVATSLVEIAGGGDGKTEVSVLVGIAVFFGGTALAGGYLARRMFGRTARATQATSAEVAEKRVLALAAKLGGRTTVAEAAARCGLTVAESREVLERLVSHGVAEILVAGDGTMVYGISGLLTAEAKAAATDPLAS